jgi:hypothetical protein
MNKFNSFLAEHGTKIIIALLVLVYFKSCSISSNADKIKKDLRAVETEIDTLNATIESMTITTEEMKDLIRTTPAWNTLRIEEMSDKERISINAIKAREEGYDK